MFFTFNCLPTPTRFGTNRFEKNMGYILQQSEKRKRGWPNSHQPTINRQPSPPPPAPPINPRPPILPSDVSYLPFS